MTTSVFPVTMEKAEFEKSIQEHYVVKIAGKGNLPNWYGNEEKAKYRKDYSTFYKNFSADDDHYQLDGESRVNPFKAQFEITELLISNAASDFEAFHAKVQTYAKGKPIAYIFDGDNLQEDTSPFTIGIRYLIETGKTVYAFKDTILGAKWKKVDPTCCKANDIDIVTATAPPHKNFRGLQVGKEIEFKPPVSMNLTSYKQYLRIGEEYFQPLPAGGKHITSWTDNQYTALVLTPGDKTHPYTTSICHCYFSYALPLMLTINQPQKDSEIVNGTDGNNKRDKFGRTFVEETVKVDGMSETSSDKVGLVIPSAVGELDKLGKTMTHYSFADRGMVFLAQPRI